MNNAENITKNIDGWVFHTHAWDLLHVIMREIATMQGVETILDYGAGSGIAAGCIKSMFPDKMVYVSDIDPCCIDEWEKRDLDGCMFDITEGDAWEIPIYFNLLICSHVLEHTLNPEKYIKEFAKTAKHLILIVPDGYVDDPTHQKIYNRQTFKKTIDDAITYKSIRYYPHYHPHINNLVAVIETW